MADWDQFSTLGRLSFVITGVPEDQTAKVYANSLNMVEAVVTVELFAKDDQPLNVSDDELKAQLYFCHFETGEELKSPWMISDDPNDYVIGPTEKLANTDSSGYVKKYISCTKYDGPERTSKIAVGIEIPGVGKFDTSSNGTSTKQPDGDVFKAPQSVELTALYPIDYSNHDNISIECGDFETIKSDYKWAAIPKTDDDFKHKEHWNGKYKRRIVYIRPNMNVTGQDKFKKYKVVYDPLFNPDVFTGTVDLNPKYTDYRSPNGFSLIYGEYDKPGSVVTRGWDRDDYQVNMWYPRRSLIVSEGMFITHDDDCYYLFNENGNIINEDHRGDDEAGAATLLLVKFIMPVAKTYQAAWHDVPNSITVNVTDLYGNDGSFKLVFNDSDNFDQPGLA